MLDIVNRIHREIEAGNLTVEEVMYACLSFMSSDDLEDMVAEYQLFDDIDEVYYDEYDDSMDGDLESGLASAGFGTDEDYE